MTLKNKKILIIIGGGIAAYKSLDLIRLLKKNHMEVKTILTKDAHSFVTPLTLSTVSKNEVIIDFSNEPLMMKTSSTNIFVDTSF